MQFIYKSYNCIGGISIFISDYIKANVKGHCHFDFVDVYLRDDTTLFIDPCLLEGADDPWSVNASRIMSTYFDCLFEGFRQGTLKMSSLLSHSGELNATKLGYGNGENGKGKTEEGLYESLKGLETLVHEIPTICRAQDIPVLVEGFAEDCLSDMLTNILHEPLNLFTAQQMEKWGCPSTGGKIFWTFDADNCQWIEVMRPSWFYLGKEVLLVPKWIVRRNFLFKAHQYLYSVIIGRMRDNNGWQDLKKVDIWNNIARKSAHWEYDEVISYSKNNPEALAAYHDRIPFYYNRAHGHMSNADLDLATYVRQGKSA